MGYSVKDALKARKKGKVSVEDALSERKEWVSQNLSSIKNDINTRYNSIVENYSRYSSEQKPTWGVDAAETYKKQREYSLAVSELKKDIEAYRKYLDADTVDNVSKVLDNISSGYDAIYSNAKLYSQFKNEEEYNASVKKMKLNEEMVAADLGKVKEEIGAWEKIREHVKTAEARLVHKWKNQAPNRDSVTDEEWMQYLNDKSWIDQYGSLQDVVNTLNEKQQYYNQANLIQKREVLSNVGNSESKAYDANFDLYVQKGYDIAAKDGKHPALAIHNGEEIPKKGNWLLDFIESYRTDYDIMGLKALNDSQFDTLAYYLAYDEEHGTNKFDEYLEVLRPEFANDLAEDVKGLEFAFAVAAGLDQFGTNMGNLFNTQDDYIAPSTIQLASAQVRENLAESGPQILGSSLGQLGYDLINTTANMVPSILASAAVGMVSKTAGAAVGAGLMGTSAAGGAYQEALNAGYSKSQARTYSTLIGASEAALSYALSGIGKLGGKLTGNFISKAASKVDSALLRFAINYGGKLGSEALEEGLQEVLNPIFKNMVLDTDEKVDWEQVAYSALLGAMSAGVFETGGTVATEVKTYKDGKAIMNKGKVAELVDFAKGMSTDSNAYRIASKINEKSGAYTVGRLLHETGTQALSEANIADISKSLERKGYSQKSAKKIAGWLDAAVRGENLTTRQQKLLEESDLISQTFADVVMNDNSTVKQRVRKFNDIISTNNPDSAIDGQNPAEFGEQIATEQRDVTKSENLIKSKFEVAEDGKAYNKKTDESVNVSKIASIENGKIKLELDDGSIVDANDVELATEDEAVIYSIILDMGVDATVANALVENFNARGNISASDYALGIKEAHLYGFYGMPAEQLTSQDSFAAELSADQRALAYDLGRKSRNLSDKKAQENIDKKRMVADGKSASNTGKVFFNGDKLSLNEIKRESLKGLEILAQVIKKDFHIYESYKLNGKRVYKDSKGVVRLAPNGMYYQSDGSIWIDINAGNEGQGVVLHTAAHELTHFIKDWSPQKFRVLSDFLVEKYGEKNISVDELVRKQIQKAKENGRTISYDEAFEEFVADSMTTMLTDGKVIKELCKKDMTLAQKIKAWFDKILSKLDAIYKNYAPETAEGKYVLEMTDSYKKIQSLFTEALSEASKNFAKADVRAQKNTTQEGDVKTSLRGFTKDGRRVYETDFTNDVSMDERVKLFKERIATIFNLGAVELKTDVKKIKIEGDKFTAQKNIYGDDKGSSIEKEAKVNALYDMADILSTSKYIPTKTTIEPSYSNPTLVPKNAAHKDVKYWYKFENEIVFDGVPFTVTFNIRDKGKNQYEYLIDFKENKTPGLSNTVYKDLLRADQVSNNKIPQKEPVVNTYSMQENENNSEMHSDRDSFGNINSPIENDTDKLYNDKNGLSEPEVAAILSYKSSESYKINALLRSGEELTNADKEFVENLDNALSKLPSYKGTTYRNIIFGLIGGQEGYNAFLEKHNIGNIVSYQAFTSASTKKDGYVLDGNLVVSMVIESLNAKNVDGYGNNLESEVIFPRDATYVVNSVEYNSKGQPIIFMTEVVENDEGEHGQFHSEERGEAVQSLSTSQSRDGHLQGVSELDTSQSFGRRGNLQEISGEEGLKFSDRDYSAISNRSLLADALESAVQDDVERKKLSEYKAKIKEMDKQSEKLSELRSQIKELSFSKGPRDKAKIRALQDEAIKTANRIDLYDKQLLKLEAAKPLQNVLEREKQKAVKRQKAKDAEILKEYKRTSLEKLEETRKQYQESRKRNVEGRQKTELRHKIKRVVGELNKLLLNPTKERHIPEELRVAVADVLDIVNMDTVGAEERLAAISEQMKNETDPIKFNDLLAKYRRIMEKGDKMKDRLNALKSAYDAVKKSTDAEISGLFDDFIYDKIDDVRELVGNTSIRNMTLEQLEGVYELYTAVLNTIRDANKVFAENIKMNRRKLGATIFNEIKANNKSREYIKLEGAESLAWKYLKPMQAIKTIGSQTLQKLWNNILYGQEVFARDYDEAVKFALELKEKYGYKKWDLEKTYSFKSKSGKEMKVNLEQMMSLYAYSKRSQADEHIEDGGVLLNESFTKEKNRFGRVVKVKINDSTAYRFNKLQLAQIISTMEKEVPGATAFVDEMQGYLSDVMGNKGNEVSMKMYGIKIFKEEHYFPLRSSQEFLETENAKLKGEVKIKNKSMTKATVKHANNPIVLENFLDVWGNHINEMSMYHGLVLPLEDFSRALNYGYRANDELNIDAESVQTALRNAFGKNAINYLNNLEKAINGGILHDSAENGASTLISRFKKAKVMASLSVIIQQPTAIVRAMGIIEPKYFIANKGDRLKHKQTWEELKTYCPTAIIKETGSFDTNMGHTIVDLIREDLGFVDKVGDVLGRAPAFADETGWNMIWRALKEKVKAEQHLSGEELLQECGRQMTLILNETQVYDSVMSRNEYMRSKGIFLKMATSFMAEPTTVANMIYGAALDFKRGDKKTARRAVAATLASVMLNGLAASIVYALRDDDDEKTLLEKYVSSATTEILDGLNPLTYLPVIKDAYSLMQGYDVERTDLALFGDVVDSLENLYALLDAGEYNGMSGNEVAEHIYENTKPVISSICNMFGLPVGNILRDAEAIIVNDNLSMSETVIEGIGLAVKEGWLNASPEMIKKIFKGTKYDKLYQVANNGNTAYVQSSVADMVSEKVDAGKTEKEAKTAVKSSFTSIFKSLYVDAMKNSDFDEGNRIRKLLYATGLYGTLSELDKTLQDWREDLNK